MKRRNWAVIPAMPADALAAANCTVRGARARSDLEHPTLRPLVRHAGAVMSTNRQLDSPGEQAYGAGAGHEERAFGLRLAATMVTSRRSHGRAWPPLEHTARFVSLLQNQPAKLVGQSGTVGSIENKAA